MRKSYNKILILEFIFLIFLIFNSFVFKISNPYVIFGIILPFLLITLIFFGMEKDNFRYKKDVFLNLLICILIYYFITYFLGFFTGFYKTSYSLSIINIFKNIFPILLVIISSEILRYLIISKTKGNVFNIVLGCILFILIDVNMMVHMYDVTTALGLTKMICLVVFPSITKNIFLTFLTIKTGYKNAIFYRIVTELNTYLFPIFPDFGEYLNILIKTILPIIIMSRINNLFNYYEIRKIKDSKYNSRKLILYSIITFVLLIIVLLTSGLFKYQALTIGSGSMTPKIEKGDIVILESLKSSEISEIKKDDILVYNHENKIIVHRVIKISNVNNKITFRTKGDNNDTKDSWIVKESDVIGIVKFKIKWLGMPTVALNELLNK